MTDPIEAVGPDDHTRGDGADLELVMYGDFECPYCAAAQRILARVEDRLDGRLRLVFRHFPLEQVHPHAMHAAQVAEAAAAQGALLGDARRAVRGARPADRRRPARPRARPRPRRRPRARRARAAASHARARASATVAGGVAAGVTGTPGFFANGAAVGGAFDAGSLVDALLA